MDITEQLDYAESQLDRLTDERDKLIEDYQWLNDSLATMTARADTVLQAKLVAVEKVLADWQRAYPTDIFPEIVDGETKGLVGLADRISASMGRHMAKLLEAALGAT